MIAATVDLVEHLGGDTYHLCLCARPAADHAAPGWPDRHSTAATPIAIRFTTDHLHIFDETGAALARP